MRLNASELPKNITVTLATVIALLCTGTRTAGADSVGSGCVGAIVESVDRDGRLIGTFLGHDVIEGSSISVTFRVRDADARIANLWLPGDHLEVCPGIPFGGGAPGIASQVYRIENTSGDDGVRAKQATKDEIDGLFKQGPFHE
jgi:hypothetical protein